MATAIQNIYVKHLGDKYDILKPEVQEKIFGKQMIHVITSSEDREAFYADSNNNDIIVTSSGMCEGGPILAHLPKILKDEDASLVFIGYAPETTL